MDPIEPKKHRVLIWTIATLSVLALFLVVLFKETDFPLKIKGFEQATNDFLEQTLKNDTLTPPPLRGVFNDNHEPLTVDGILQWTNKNRQDAEEKDLTINLTLSKMAEKKLNDLFEKQYFEHESPTGVGPGGLAKQVGYDYIIIGENLALGNFNGDQALVDAWMASPGHRANILNLRYREIGIAVGQGTFEGKKTWIAVQEFGLPITACQQPSVLSKTTIETAKKKLEALESSLTLQKAAIDSADPKFGKEYNEKVEQYNVSVKEFNALVTSLKSKISAYNKQVAAFNACAEVSTSQE